MINDGIEAVGHVRVTKKDVKTGEIVYDKVFKNKITDFARGFAAKLWVGTVLPTPDHIAVGTGTNSAGPQSSDSALWNEVSNSRQAVDYATTFLNYYSQYAVTYDQTKVLASTVSNFSDSLTEYTGSSANGWTVTSGSVTFGSNGATMGSNGGTLQSADATNMDPSNVNGPVTLQATFKVASASNESEFFHLVQDSNNYYSFYINGGLLRIGKVVNGVSTYIGGSAVTLTSGSTYTMKASIDSTNTLTVNLYSGSTATGTALATYTTTDMSLPGPYTLAVGGASNDVISNVQATYPNPDTTLQIALTEAGLFDANGNLFSHVQLNGVTHDNTTTLSIQWQVMQNGN